MGKSLPPSHTLHQFARLVSSPPTTGPHRPAQLRPVSKARPAHTPSPEPHQHHLRTSTRRRMEAAAESSSRRRTPLAEVVSDCVQRWFQDTLKEAKNGDTAMQVLVGQMYYSGYGVDRDVQRGKAWISRASRSRSSVWKVGDKHPGYNASDSDSDDAKEEAK